ncbi:MAG: hypothetical protein WKF96_17385 [Solirubrobacteraceae bacterium]
MTKQALNYLLGQMEAGGYLQRREDAGDQRSKRIHLTTRGHRAVKAIREIVTDVESQWERQLGPMRFAELRELLIDLNALVTPPHDTNDAPR